jgi:hypothetical protein
MIEKHHDYTPYAYVYNNPIMFIDPFGLDSTKISNGFSKRMDQHFKTIGAVINDPKSIIKFINGLIDDPLGTIDNILGSAAEALDNSGKKLMGGTNEDFGEVLADGFTFWLTGKVLGGTSKKPSNYVELSSASNTSSTSLTKFYPGNNGFLGTPESTFLMPGNQISRYGSTTGKYFSPAGTPLEMRSMPPGANTNVLNNYNVLKPFSVQSGTIAPAFNQLGLGIQYVTPVSASVLLKHGIITPLK